MNDSMIPIQIRMTRQEIQTLDQIADALSQDWHGLKRASRPDALRWAFQHGAAALLRGTPDAATGGGVAPQGDDAAARLTHQRERSRRNSANARARKREAKQAQA